MGSMIRYLEEVESTQDEMKSWIRESGAGPLDAVLAERQSSGRGRQGSSWISPGLNFFASILVVPENLPLTWIPLRVGVVTHEALSRMGFGDVGLRLKWPNDLWVGGPAGDAKLGGILCEKMDAGVVAGIGINVQSAPRIPGRETACLASLRPGFPFPATLNGGFCRSLLEEILLGLSRPVELPLLRSRFEELSWFMAGDPVAWSDPATGKEGHGRYEGIGEHGEMVVSMESGRVRLYSEEVRRIRPGMQELPE
jgi:BirA family biotin operon repressor/biotin-[acetyl-CoA-carboxylase] ligase